jgi:signal peptidase I
MNYIKRLIGLPGETIAIHYGKLYVLDGLQYDDSQVPPLELWDRRYMHTDDPEAQRLFHAGRFHMIRKSPQEMLAMRRLVFDNDHQPKDLIGKVPPRWTSEAGSTWKPDDPKTPKLFKHSAVEQGSGTAWLRYRHLIPDGNRLSSKPELITDVMGYNTWEERRGNHLSPGQDWVGDLMLECEVQVEQAQGDLTLELSKGVDRFQARFDLATGLCTLFRLADGRESKLESKETTLRRPGKYRLRFADFDERLTVWVDSALPFGEGAIYPAPAHHGPTQENDLQPASIGVRGGGVAVARLKLWRDTYYTVYINSGDANGPIDFSRPGEWEPLRNLPVRTMYVQPNHFLCLGDNSRESSDGRSWGTVPKRLLLGRALLIYYPLTSRAGRIE